MESARFGTFAAADRTTLHELNTRLARYVEHVQRLEARNRALRSDLLTARRQRGSAPGAIDTRDAEVRRSRETVRVLSLEVARDALLRERLRGERAWQQARLESEERGLHELQAASEAALHEVEEQRAFAAELEAGAERIAREMESACETHTREMSAWRARLQQLQRVSGKRRKTTVLLWLSNHQNLFPGLQTSMSAPPCHVPPSLLLTHDIFYHH